MKLHCALSNLPQLFQMDSVEQNDRPRSRQLVLAHALDTAGSPRAEARKEVSVTFGEGKVTMSVSQRITFFGLTAFDPAVFI